jgi:hypothetical protein
MKATVTGVDRVLRAIGKARTQDAINIDQGLKKCAKVILNKAMTVVPRETGALAASHRIVGNDKQGFAARYAVEAGGPSAYYALYVHEDLTKHHAPPTMAKWLEYAVRMTRGTCSAILKRTMGAERGKTIDGVREDITAGNPYTGG